MTEGATRGVDFGRERETPPARLPPDHPTEVGVQGGDERRAEGAQCKRRITDRVQLVQLVFVKKKL